LKKREVKLLYVIYTGERLSYLPWYPATKGKRGTSITSGENIFLHLSMWGSGLGKAERKKENVFLSGRIKKIVAITCVEPAVLERRGKVEGHLLICRPNI